MSVNSHSSPILERSSVDWSTRPIVEHFDKFKSYDAIDSLSTHNNGDMVDLIGVVVHFSEIKPTRGTDMSRSMIVCDPTAPAKSAGVMVQFYKPDSEDLPRPVPGSVIVLRCFKLHEYRGTFQAWSNRQSSWVIYDANGTSAINKSSVNDTAMTQDLEEYVQRLSTWWRVRQGSYTTESIPLPANVNSISSHTGQRATLNIRDVREHIFFDIYAYVVKTFPTRDNAFTLYITDYTPNDNLHDYVFGEAKWQGPYGQYVMQVTVWDSHAYYARANVHEHTYVHLRNVQGKRSNSGRLEGALRGDRMHPDRVNVTSIKANDPLVKNIILRKQQYDATWKFERERLEEERVRNMQAEKTLQLTPPTSINPNIETSYSQVPTTAIGDILEPPFIPHVERSEGPGSRKRPKKFRTVARIVDFWPTDLRDFARPYCMTCQLTYRPTDPELKVSSESPIPEQCTICSATKDSQDPDTYEFAFTVLVEGQDCVYMPIIFSGDDLEVLFSDEDLQACNLYLPENQIMLSRLREKLFLLWGDLEERFMAPSRKRKIREEVPLMWTEFCVMEYHVNEVGGTAGWKGRRFKAFGMRIL